jgi:hypothetical protein
MECEKEVNKGRQNANQVRTMGAALISAINVPNVSENRAEQQNKKSEPGTMTPERVRTPTKYPSCVRCSLRCLPIKPSPPERKERKRGVRTKKKAQHNKRKNKKKQKKQNNETIACIIQTSEER